MLVSIIIPTKNRGHIINETLDSIICQTYTNWECIIVDDGSNDNTETIITTYILKDARFKYYKRPNDYPSGGNGARNYGFKKSKGTYVNWFDSDDIMYPNKIEIQVKAFTGKLDFVACYGRHFGTHTSTLVIKETHNDPLYDYFFNTHSFPTPSILWKKDFLLNKSLFNNKLVIYQELEFHYRMLAHRPTYLIRKEELYKVRRGHQSIVVNRSKSKFKYSTLNCFKSNYSVTQEVNDIQKPLKKKILNYLSYRITSVSFGIMADMNLKNRLIFFYSNFNLFNGFKNHMRIISYIKIMLGYFLFIIFSKGYNVFLPKKFDYRNSIR